jgi:cytoskeletal protein CcmA (bactofilin family)
MEEKPTQTNDDANALETSSSNDVDGAGALESAPSAADSKATAKSSEPKKSFGMRIRGLITHLNIYLLLFIFIVVLSGGIVLVAFQRDKKAATPTTITTQPLTSDTLNQLKNTEAKVGDPKQTLTIESNAIFSGKVLVRDSLDVAGSLKVGGNLTLPGLTVSGTGNIAQIQGNSLAINGNGSFQGQVTIQKNLTVSAGATFGGPISAPVITTQSLQMSGDLQVTRHIDAGGGTPGKSDGSALGNGGTSSVSGTDTAGTITINTGGSPGTGCFTTVNFTQKFSGTPHVVVTPVGSAAAGLNYYINRNNSNFSVCTTNPAPAGQTFSFDYIAMD